MEIDKTTMELEFDDDDNNSFFDLIDNLTLENVFKHLDCKTLLKTSETCQRFEEIMSTSKSLMKKIKFKISFPEDEGMKKILKALQACNQHLSRRYLNLQIVRLRDNILNSSDEMRETFLTIISKLAAAVINLEINNCYLLRYDITVMLGQFTNLVEMRLENLMFSDDFTPSDIAQEDQLNFSFPNLKVLRLIQCDFYILLQLKSHESLKILEISIPSYNRSDVEKLENFLLKQKDLKDLKLVSFRFNSSYSTDRLAKVPFQLNSLYLQEVSWDINDHCLLFLKSQLNLQSFALKRFRSWIWPQEANFRWFCDAMKHVLVNNPLKSVCIDTTGTSAYMLNSIFLEDLCNHHVTRLTYCRDVTDTSQLFYIFMRLFPKVSSLKFTDGQAESDCTILQHLHRYKDLSKVLLVAKPQLLDYFSRETVEHLTSFKFYATNEDKSLDRLKQLFAGNTKIENVTLEVEPLTIEEITELIIGFSQTLRKLRIQDLHLNSAEADLFVRNFPNLRYLCSDIAVSQEVLNILNKSHVNFRLSNGSRF